MPRNVGVYVPDKRWPPVAFQVLAQTSTIFASVSNLTSLKTVVGQVAGNIAIMNNYATGADLGGGLFVWSTANHATDVTNDPGGGIFVPSNADTTGATGCWIRQYDGEVSLAWWGAITDGVTDNSNVWKNWNTWARGQSAAGKGVDVIVPPGQLNYDLSVFNGFLWNIKQLHIKAYGCTMQNTYNQSIHGGNFGFELGWPGNSAPLRDGNNNLKSWLIQTTQPGDTQVTTVTAGDASATNFTVNDWVVVMSLDIQYFGYPPNCDQVDFARVLSFNPGTGVIVLDRPLRYNHRSDFPDGPPGIIACGKARIWQCNTQLWPQGGPLLPNNGLVTFDVDHTYEGMTVNQAPTSSLTYVSINGKRVRTINWTGVGHSESTAHTVIHENADFLLTGEPDKIVERIHYINCKEHQTIGFQSSSINEVIFTNPVCLGQLNAGQAKHVLVDGGTADSIGTADVANFGYNRSTVFRGTHIRSMPILHGVPRNNGINSISGDVSYANGVFKIAQTFAGQQGIWNTKPGGQIILGTTNQVYPGDIGIGYVLSITEDVNFIYITTTFPFASLPAWANGTAYIHRGGVERFEGCCGSDGALSASQATAVGRNPWDYFRFVFLGQTAVNGSFFPGLFGIAQEITFDVVQPCATANSTLQFQCFGCNTLADPTVSIGAYAVSVRTDLRGKRIFNQDVFDGLQTGDFMQLGGVNQTKLPIGIVGDFFWNVAGYTPSGITPQQCPIVEVTFKMDVRQFRKQLPTQFDAGGGGPNTIIGNISGTFQA